MVERQQAGELLAALRYLSSPQAMPLLGVSAGLTLLMAQTGLFDIWTQSEEYGHGLMVVFVLGYLVSNRWQAFEVSKAGHLGLVLLLGLCAFGAVIVGESSGINLVAYYGAWLFIAAFVYALGGLRLIGGLAVPLLIIPLLFPLPNPFGPMLTAELQLISSRLGVWFIRAMGGSVYLEGNVLDMGGAKLLVAEACAGLRYLFPLMSLGGILGYVLQAPYWVRWSAFLITIPITIFMNSFRIAVTGILVEQGGSGHTEGFLHFFEGWVVFVLAALLLLGWSAVAVRLQARPSGLSAAIRAGLERVNAEDHSAFGNVLERARASAWGLTAIMVVTVAVAAALGGRTEASPDRQPLNAFPEVLGEWHATIQRLASEVENVAGASDYFYGDYRRGTDAAVNAYVAYYETQRHGQIPHSPKVCIPGGGWRIESVEGIEIAGPEGAMQVNRLVTALGERKVIAYYWLKQGTGIYRSEMLARLSLVRSSLLENRTDGALVRILTEVQLGETMQDADRRLSEFAQHFNPVLSRFVPD